MGIRNTNDGTQAEPYLRADFNYAIFRDLPDYSTGPKGSDEEKHKAIKAEGYMGLQNGIPEICRDLGLGYTKSGRVNKPGEAKPMVEEILDEGWDCLTFHVGWGMESQELAEATIEDILRVSEEFDFPMYIETHRATITQDMYRTVEFIKKYPEMRMVGDYSHYYTGLNMSYGEYQDKFDYLSPIFERTRFLQGRIGDPNHIVKDIGDGTGERDSEYYFMHQHLDMWIEAMVGFLKSAGPGDFICHNAELLGVHQWRNKVEINGKVELREEFDRWTQSHVYKRLAIECFKKAKERVKAGG